MAVFLQLPFAVLRKSYSDKLGGMEPSLTKAKAYAMIVAED